MLFLARGSRFLPSFLFCGKEVKRVTRAMSEARFSLGGFFATGDLLSPSLPPLSFSSTLIRPLGHPRTLAPPPSSNLQPPLGYYWLVSREDVIIRAAPSRDEFHPEADWRREKLRVSTFFGAIAFNLIILPRSKLSVVVFPLVVGERWRWFFPLTWIVLIREKCKINYLQTTHRSNYLSFHVGLLFELPRENRE